MDAYDIREDTALSKLVAEGFTQPYLRKPAIVFADDDTQKVAVRSGDLLYSRVAAYRGVSAFETGGIDLSRVREVETTTGTYAFELLGCDAEYQWGRLVGSRGGWLEPAAYLRRGDRVTRYIFEADSMAVLERFHAVVSGMPFSAEEKTRLVFNEVVKGVPVHCAAAINDTRNAWLSKKRFPPVEAVKEAIEMVSVSTAWLKTRAVRPNATD
jgi:hypothetical protein